MSTITTAPTPTTTSAAAATSATTPQSLILSSTDFMQILLAEFQNQDTTAPTDPTQFASQLVEFANLGQLQNIDQAVQPTNSTDLMQAASAFLGREVVALGDQIGVLNNQASTIAFTVPSTDTYTALVYNAAGQQVANVSLGQQTAATLQSFTWQPGSSPDGQYSVQIVNSAGAPVAGLVEQGVVQSVALSSGAVELNLGNLSVAGSQVTSVSSPQTN